MSKDDIIDTMGVVAKMSLSFMFGVAAGLAGIIAWSGKEMTKRFRQ